MDLEEKLNVCAHTMGVVVGGLSVTLETSYLPVDARKSLQAMLDMLTTKSQMLFYDEGEEWLTTRSLSARMTCIDNVYARCARAIIYDRIAADEKEKAEVTAAELAEENNQPTKG